MAELPPTYARVTSLEVPKRFYSARDNQFSAVVEFENDSDYVHSAQVVFRGYVRDPRTSSGQESKKKKVVVEDHQEKEDKKGKKKKKKEKEKEKKAEKEKKKEVKKEVEGPGYMHYEFLHEQIWLLIDQRGRVKHEAFLDVWLPRFPPSGPIYKGGPIVEYSCRVSVDPWFENHHVEKTFEVIRSLTLKQPHLSAYPNHIKVNQCMDHGSLFHKECKPINGEIWTEKGAYTAGEKFRVHWKLMYSDTLSDAKVSLIRSTQFREPDPASPQLMSSHVDTLATTSLAEQRKDKEKEKEIETDNSVSLTIPDDIAVTLPMTIFNVMAVTYEILLQVRVGSGRKYADFHLPIIIASDYVEGRTMAKRPAPKNKLITRAIDIDDDSADDDDTDSEVEDNPDQAALNNRDYSIEVENLMVATRASGQLYNAYAEVHLLVNSHVARSITGLRLLFTGECRAQSTWYEFLRYKAIVATNPGTALSPGEHVIKVALPFADSQYDTNILAPSLDDDIRYTCKVTLNSWTHNAIRSEREVFVDRYVDTWAKKEYQPPYDEVMGPWGVKMRQRNFQRGRWIFAKVTGDCKGVRFQLVQRRRLRIPGVRMDDSYLHERLITHLESPQDRSMWPSTEWALQIPPFIQPSIEIAYWNVLMISYALVVYPKGHDNHEHQHTIPIWIGTTDDGLEPPETIVPTAPPPTQQLVRLPSDESIPEFEVWDRDEVHIQPWWVERFDQDTYSFEERAPLPPNTGKEDKKKRKEEEKLRKQEEKKMKAEEKKKKKEEDKMRKEEEKRAKEEEKERKARGEPTREAYPNEDYSRPVDRNRPLEPVHQSARPTTADLSPRPFSPHV